MASTGFFWGDDVGAVLAFAEEAAIALPSQAKASGNPLEDRGVAMMVVSKYAKRLPLSSSAKLARYASGLFLLGRRSTLLASLRPVTSVIMNKTGVMQMNLLRTYTKMGIEGTTLSF
jgi:hypothetical protein